MRFEKGFPIFVALFLGLSEAANCQAEDQKTESVIVVQNASVRFRDRVSLSLERSGIISKVLVREGDVIEAGTLLASLEDCVAKKALAVAEAEAASEVEIFLAEKKFESSSIEYQAVLSANRLKSKAFGETDVQRLKLAADSAKIEIDLQRHKLHLARLRRDQAQSELDTYQLRAPFAGVVTKVLKNIGEAVSQQDVMIELVGTRYFCVDGYLDLQSALRVRAGDLAHVAVENPVQSDSLKKSIQGTLRFVDVSFQRVRGVVRVIADFETKDPMFRDGLNVAMTISPRRESRDDQPIGK